MHKTTSILSFLVLFAVLGSGIGYFLATFPTPTSNEIPTTNQTVVTPVSTSHEAEDLLVDISNLRFAPDAGIRVENASNPGVKMDGDRLLLLYESHESGGERPFPQVIAQADESSDWLNFTPSISNANAHTFRAHQLPDGTWRAYGFNSTIGIEGTCLTSRSSTDGVTYTNDQGCRYELQEADNGRMGVYELFNQSNGTVVLLYIGDMFGLNNVRRAVSTDNGMTFAFDHGNVLGDENAGGTRNSFVDEKVIALSETSFYLISMKQGDVFGFLSTDDGETFVPQGRILALADFKSNATSLNDPQMIRLPDGRYRIYVTLFDQRNNLTSIVSATTYE